VGYVFPLGIDPRAFTDAQIAAVRIGLGVVDAGDLLGQVLGGATVTAVPRRPESGLSSHDSSYSAKLRGTVVCLTTVP
jgi:hypothetical protein